MTPVGLRLSLDTRKNMLDNNGTSEDDDVDSILPEPPSPSASVKDSLNVTIDLINEQEEEIIQWIAEHPVIYYPYFN